MFALQYALLFQSLDAVVGGDNVAERAGDEEPGGDPLGAGDHQPHHAELPRRCHRPVGGQGGEGGDVRDHYGWKGVVSLLEGEINSPTI